MKRKILIAMLAAVVLVTGCGGDNAGTASSKVISDNINIIDIEAADANQDDEDKDAEDKEDDKKITISMDALLKTESYANSISNNAGVDENVVALISEFMNRYYHGVKYLQSTSFADLFSSSGQDYGYLFEKSLDTLINHRLKSSHDLHLNSASYDLNISSASRTSSGALKVVVYQSDTFNFRFLNGTTSRQGGIVNYFYVTTENGQYKLDEVYHEEGFYLNFAKRYGRTSNYKATIDGLYSSISSMFDQERAKLEADRAAVNQDTVRTSLTATTPYDRSAAQSYAKNYAHSRHGNHPSFSSNCINFCSQTINAGGIPMDSTGNYQWYSNSPSSYKTTWTYIPHFWNFISNDASDGDGTIVYDYPSNVYLAEPGDIYSVDRSDRHFNQSPHVVVATDIIYDGSGNIVDILTAGNTINQSNWPVSAMGYPYINLLKIVGYN